MATMTAPLPTETAAKSIPGGGSFLISTTLPEAGFLPEDFTDEQKLIAETTMNFATNDGLPMTEAIESKDFKIIRGLLKKAGDLGLLAADIPEEYDGLSMGKIVSAIIAENMSKQGSFSVAISAHTAIGTMPLVWYGTHEQKLKYLPKLATGELIAAYALSESTSGSDAVNAGTRAVLSEDGSTYTLNGEKMWISNGGFADLYTVFAKCMVTEGKDAGKEKLTAFLIERGTPGFTNGKEEHKLGIRGSSTTPLILTDCKIPAGNLLHQVGQGAAIAFNILNVGRYKLGNAAVGGAKAAFNNAVKYSKDRKAFGKSISEFGLIQQKVADMASSIYAAESMAYRTVGAIEAALETVDKNDTIAIQKQIENYAAECSMVKVFGSEMLDMVVDESLQIFAGYGYVEEYPAERAYRDARINRIFEGTNEINRLITTGWVMKQAMAGRIALMPAIKTIMDEVMSPSAPAEEGEGPLAAENGLLASAKKLSLFVAGAAMQKYMQKISDEQEVMAALSDMITAVYTIESSILRAEKIYAKSGAAAAKVAILMTQLHTAQAMEVLEKSARKVIAAVAEGDMAKTQFAILRRLLKHDPADTIALRKQVAAYIIDAGKFTV